MEGVRISETDNAFTVADKGDLCSCVTAYAVVRGQRVSLEVWKAANMFLHWKQGLQGTSKASTPVYKTTMRHLPQQYQLKNSQCAFHWRQGRCVYRCSVLCNGWDFVTVWSTGQGVPIVWLKNSLTRNVHLKNQSLLFILTKCAEYVKYIYL